MKLVHGAGSEKTGACWMSAIHFYTRKDTVSWTDQPECVSPLIRHLCILLNDHLPTNKERERVIGPHLFAPVGTNTTNEDEGKRWALTSDRAARLFVPFWLRRTKKPDLIAHAEKCEALTPIIDRETALAALPTLKASRNAAYAYASASASAYGPAYASAYQHTYAYAYQYTYAYAYQYTYVYASHHTSKAEKEWLHSEMLRLILECCAVGRQAEERIATKSRSEVIEFLCSFERRT